MHSPVVGRRAGRIAVSLVAASLTLSACRADEVTGLAAGCATPPKCDETEAVSPMVFAALEDASTRLTGALSDATAVSLVNRLDQLALALSQRDLLAGRLALAATYDALGHAVRTTPDARPDIDAIRLALLPAARALGVSTYAASSATP